MSTNIANKKDARLDAVFFALSDRTRRSLLVRLSRGDASITELAEPFDMTLPAVSKHLRVLERAGLVKLPTATQVLLKKGQQVRITGGSFAGQIGIYEGMSGKDRERVLLNLLGQAVPVDLPGKDVAPLNVASPSRLRY